jgi:hypothetical protein
MGQLTAAHLSWKGYYQGLPYPGFRGFCYPGRCNGVPDIDPVYAAKHNGAIYFDDVRNNPDERAKMVPIAELDADLGKEPPRFGYIVPDMCHDGHGAPPHCGDSGDPGDTNDNQLVGRLDRYAASLVARITGARFWSHGDNAIVITFDEGADGDTGGCCDADPGAGKVATIVITSQGPRHLQDPTPYNHYSLLQTFQRTFGLGCLEATCDTAHVTPMAPLFQIAR